ncbi:MAG: LD-carboxypeptidase [Myxococcales bacterium]|nr:LD-carboxypeptidase [Myxococcales bacterium]
MTERPTDFLLPPALRPGSVVRVVAPSSPFEPTLAWRGLGWLARRYEVRFSRSIFARHAYLAGDDARRRDELQAALIEPEVAAVICARGGYGVSRYAHQIDWSQLREHPRWLVGFSDVTGLHIEAAKVRVASLHASHLTALGRSDGFTRDGLVATLEAPTLPRRYDGLTCLQAGEAEGPLFGGNLTLLFSWAAAGRLEVPKGAVLLLEDVSEQPYRLDRALTSLMVGGHLDDVAAVVLGDFTDCRPGPDGRHVDEVLRERLSALAVPVVARLPVGHARRNDPVVLGAPTRVSAGDESHVSFFAPTRTPTSGA